MMQSETADFAPIVAIWRTGGNWSFILAYSVHYMKTIRHPQNRKYINYCIVDSPSEQDRARAVYS